MPKESRAFLGAIALLALVLVWSLLGAPLTQAEFLGIPSQFQMSATQFPVRFQRVFSLWHSKEASFIPSSAETALVTVYDTSLKQTVALSMADYLLGVLAAEMPASYHLEALKSQAVAARTRVFAQLQAGCANHPEANICSDSAHCQGYLSEQGQKDKWGAEYAIYKDRIIKAVAQTKDLILTYEGKPIEVLYHAVSGGRTEDAKAVFGSSVPYLVGVESRGEEGVNKYETTQTFQNAEAVRLLNAAFPAANLTQELLPVQMFVLTVTDSGRAETVQLGDTVVSGRDIRTALSLNSTLFTMQASEASVTFTQRGYGHGVGMSQAGANAMAAGGQTFENILTHYFTGVTVSNLNELSASGETE